MVEVDPILEPKLDHLDQFKPKLAQNGPILAIFRPKGQNWTNFGTKNASQELLAKFGQIGRPREAIEPRVWSN